MSTKPSHYLVRLLGLLITTLSVGSAYPASKEPINIEADNAKIIEKEGKSVYTGNVVLIQGSIRMTADTLTVISSDGKLTQITAQGNPVTYHEASQPEGNDISGEANLLEYFAKDDRILLSENAKLTQGGTTFGGNRIEYNIATDVVTAEVSESGNERVQVTIQPDQPLKKPAPDKPQEK